MSAAYAALCSLAYALCFQLDKCLPACLPRLQFSKRQLNRHQQRRKTSEFSLGKWDHNAISCEILSNKIFFFWALNQKEAPSFWRAE